MVGLHTVLLICLIFKNAGTIHADDISSLLDELRSLREMTVRGLSDIGHILENVKAMQTQHEEILRNAKSETSDLKFEIMSNRNAIGEGRVAMAEQTLKITQDLSSVLNMADNCKENVKKEEEEMDDDTMGQAMQSIAYPRHCADIQKSGHDKSGIYTIYLHTETSACIHDSKLKPVQVYCDLDTDQGGWTVISRRMDNSGDFHNQNWTSYASGFGQLCQSFWLGNKKMHWLSREGDYSLRVDLQAWTGEKAHALYKRFWVADEMDDFRLFISGYSGTAGDSLSYNSGMAFTTKDRDNDASSSKNCAQYYNGGWWFDSCHNALLTGDYLIGNHGTGAWKGIMWKDFKGSSYSYMKAEMKIRPVDFEP